MRTEKKRKTEQVKTMFWKKVTVRMKMTEYMTMVQLKMTMLEKM